MSKILSKLLLKVQSFFFNKSKKYTIFGLIVNWGLIITLVAFSVIIFLGESIVGQSHIVINQKKLEDLPSNVMKYLLSIALLFLTICFFTIYKIVRRIFKPDKLKKNWKKRGAYTNKRDVDFFGDKDTETD